MYDPIAGGALSQFLLHQRVLVSEQLHGELVVGRLEECDDLITQVVGWRRGCSVCGCRLQFAKRRHLLFRRPIQTDVVTEIGEGASQSVNVFASEREIWTWRDVVANQ